MLDGLAVEDGERLERGVSGRAASGGEEQRDHDRDQGARGYFLLRRGLPSAVLGCVCLSNLFRDVLTTLLFSRAAKPGSRKYCSAEPTGVPMPTEWLKANGGNLGRVFGPSTVPNRGARSASRTRKSRSTPRSKQSERLHGRPRRFNRHPAVYNQHNQPMRTFTARAPRRAIDRRSLDVSARLVFSNGFIHPNTTLTKITIAFSAIRGTLR